MLKKPGLLLLLSFTLVLFLGMELTENDARKIITHYLGYPKPLMTVIHPGPAGSSDTKRFRDGINKLLKDGFLKSPPGSSKEKLYEPTSKSAGYVTRISVQDSFPLYEGAVCNEVVRKIDSIRLDKKGDTAVVTFTLGIEPIEPFYGLFCINKFCDYYGKLDKTEKQKLKLRKTARGWALSN